MSKTPYQVDKEGFETAAAGYPELYPNRDAHIAVRRYLVENNFLNPGDTADAQVYAMALGMMKANGTLPQRVKTAEEIAAEAQAAADLEARRNMGVVFRKNEPDKPTHVIDEFANRDALKNTTIKLTPHSPETESRGRAYAADGKSPRAHRYHQQIPGLKDESWSGNEVYIGGRVADYKTQCAVAAAKEHNAQVRAKYAEQQSCRHRSRSNSEEGNLTMLSIAEAEKTLQEGVRIDNSGKTLNEHSWSMHHSSESAWYAFMREHSGQHGLLSNGSGKPDLANLVSDVQANKHLLMDWAKANCGEGITPATLEKAFAHYKDTGQHPAAESH